MTVFATPPRWAEALLSASLPLDDFESISGDLLEQYRESVDPERGPRAADRWYVRQVLGFVWRGARLWAALLAAGFLARTGLDWRVPTHDFEARSAMTTLLGIAIFLLAGFWAGARSGRVVAGSVLGLASAAVAAPLSLIGAATLLALCHDGTTLAAIHGSGGLAEVFVLPLLAVLPGTVLGTLGGALGVATRRSRLG